ncbi:hypothetical protein C8J57DRAFT_1249923 [Mycena rebaudengoi]|nr:hypothetical protein C8J57DRAFT_1249923 [Mycena rebaudengoi]
MGVAAYRWTVEWGRLGTGEALLRGLEAVWPEFIRECEWWLVESNQRCKYLVVSRLHVTARQAGWFIVTLMLGLQELRMKENGELGSARQVAQSHFGYLGHPGISGISKLTYGSNDIPAAILDEKWYSSSSS